MVKLLRRVGVGGCLSLFTVAARECLCYGGALVRALKLGYSIVRGARQLLCWCWSLSVCLHLDIAQQLQ